MATRPARASVKGTSSIKNSPTAKKSAKKAAKKTVEKVSTKKAMAKKAAANKTPAIKKSAKRVTASGTVASAVLLPDGYKPSEKEAFMNPLQTEYFRQKLLAWREELLSEATGMRDTLSEENFQKPDITDRAQIENNASLQLRTRDRERKLLFKIDAALQRIENGTYGYCEETNEPIALKRLEARPIASLSLDAQERHERMERIHRDD